MSDQPPAEVVLSAERAEVSTRWVPSERVRVHREVVTEEVTVTVTVRREVLRVVHEPLKHRSSGSASDGGGAPPSESTPGGVAAGGRSVEVVLSAERPVIALEVVPYERVRVSSRLVPTTTPVTVTASHEVVDLSTRPAP